MSDTKFERQTPRGVDGEEESAVEEMEGEAVGNGEQPPTFESLIDDIVASDVEELRDEIDELREQVAAVDDFARISLNERKVKQNEVKLSEFSDSLTGFAEKAFNKLNTLERRLDTQALLLAALVEAQEGVDLSDVRKHQSERLVMDATPEERLEAAVEAQADAQVADDD